MEGKHPGYFQGILQLRNPTKELKAFIDNEIKKEGVYVAKKVKTKDGVNMWVSSNKFLLKMSRQLKIKFSGDMKLSRKIYSRDRMTQKDIWRMTLLFKQYPFKKGETVKIRGEEYKINSLGTKVQTTHVKSGKKKLFNYEEIS